MLTVKKKSTGMKNWILLLLGLMFLFACNTTKKITPISAEEDFPITWEGIWKGDLDIFRNGKKLGRSQ